MVCKTQHSDISITILYSNIPKMSLCRSLFIRILFLVEEIFGENMSIDKAQEAPESNINNPNASTLVFNGEFKGFPQHDHADFLCLRTTSGIGYFDRTGYISKLENLLNRVLLFLRPRRFGKSLTLSMLIYFHGVEHKEHYNRLFKVNSNDIFLFHIRR
jgi:hypothetical protein